MSSATRAQELLDGIDGRSTPARREVLQILLDGNAALTRQELESVVVRRGLEIDRVTLYRVLDWLVERQLAHRIASDDRVWRFSATGTDHPGEHAHFHCRDCGRIFCLDAAAPPVAAGLPKGYRQERTEIVIHGQCPECAV